MSIRSLVTKIPKLIKICVVKKMIARTYYEKMFLTNYLELSSFNYVGLCITCKVIVHVPPKNLKEISLHLESIVG
jgi:hypothetical protein